jgi:hypothetical protein
MDGPPRAGRRWFRRRGRRGRQAGENRDNEESEEAVCFHCVRVLSRPVELGPVGLGAPTLIACGSTRDAFFGPDIWSRGMPAIGFGAAGAALPVLWMMTDRRSRLCSRTPRITDAAPLALNMERQRYRGVRWIRLLALLHLT